MSVTASLMRRPRRRRWWLVALIVSAPTYVLAAGAHDTQPAPTSARTTWDSVFTAEQAARGQTAYARTCSRCHQPALGGADESPPLAGGAFLSSWNGQTLGELHDRVRTSMPTDDPGIYSRQEVADVIAYVLSFNGYPAGNSELPVDDGALRAIVFSSTKP